MDIVAIWIVIALLATFSVILLCGKGAFLIAGYNTSGKMEKARYDEKKLCRATGGGLGVITVMMAIGALHNFEIPADIRWLLWAIPLVVIAVMILLANTICRKKN